MVNFILEFVRNNIEIFVSIQHGRDVSIGLVVENINRNVMSFCVSQFITHTKRRTSTLRYTKNVYKGGKLPPLLVVASEKIVMKDELEVYI